MKPMVAETFRTLGLGGLHLILDLIVLCWRSAAKNLMAVQHIAKTKTTTAGDGKTNTVFTGPSRCMRLKRIGART